MIMNIKNGCMKWFGEHTKVQRFSDKMYLLTLPFMDSANDYIQLYIIKENCGYRIDDDGYALINLKMHGVNVETDSVRAAINKICLNYGIKNDMGISLYTWTSEDLLIQRLIEFAGCIMQISGLYYVDNL